MKEITLETEKDEMLSHVKKALKELYSLRRTKAKGIVYEGYKMHHTVGAFCPPPDEMLSEEGLAYHLERDREPIDLLLTIAYQLGWSASQVHKSKHDTLFEELKKSIDKLTAQRAAEECDGK